MGRERDLEEVTSFLRQPNLRLLTLTGTGGVGKTRLALRAAQNAAASFPDGVAFVALAPLSDPDLVIPTVARSLGLREAGGRSPLDTLRARLQGQRLLLVLDNFEHLLEAAPEVSSLTGYCPGLTVLATSRAPLRVRGEQEYPVPPLALPASTRSPAAEEVVASPSGRLFVERARAASPAFRLQEGNAASVASICWRLDGLPLALELAAARVKFLSPPTLLSRLDRALSIGWARDLPERQQTMRATLDWSHDLLPEPAKVLLRRLSVFVGGFSLEAAEAVGAGKPEESEAVLDRLGVLVDHSLVVTESVLDEDVLRYRLLEPVREYALERLTESAEAEETQRRHAGYYLALADISLPQAPDQVQWIDRLETEHDNLRTALRWLLEQGDAGGAVRLGWELRRFWYIRGYPIEGRRWMERALTREHGLSQTRRAQALTIAAGLAWQQGDFDRAASLTDEGTRLAREAGDLEVLAMATLTNVVVTLRRGESDHADSLAIEAGALYRELGDRAGMGHALVARVHVALARGDLARAEELLVEAEPVLREAGERHGLAADLILRALVAQMRDDYAGSVALLRESLEISKALRDTQALVYALEGMAGAASMLGWVEHAARLFGATDALRE